MFAVLPSGMPLLSAAVVQMERVGVLAPLPEVEQLAKRLRQRYAAERVNRYRNLSGMYWRQLPYAYWLTGEPCLDVVDPDLVRTYWDERLPAALRTSPRKAKRWLTPLLLTYCQQFTSSGSAFSEFASRIALCINDAEGAFAQHLRGLSEAYSFFSPAHAQAKLSIHLFLNRGQTIDELLAAMSFAPSFVLTPFGDAIFAAGLGLPLDRLREPQVPLRLMDWAERRGQPIVKTDFRVRFANAMLKPWASGQPSDELRRRIIDYFLRNYGDPRGSARNFQWSAVDPQALAVFLHWLTGDTLRGFMTVLQKTADQIWRYRQKFWMAYYDRGFIDEAWVALGDDAQAALRKMGTNAQGIGFGRLEGATQNQSVLLMRLGDLVLTEWSHNGSLRAYKDTNPKLPNLYQTKYDAHDLRAVQSLDFHNGLNMNPELRHMHSETGNWQRKARDFIRRNTGVAISDREII